ncbi:MAG: hypothetical protein ONA69_08865, partial [candidate division KSB1 bacterium]|nr:hypothetical protein [candidate division KSB1 bacterium]
PVLPQDWERSDSLYTSADSLVVLTRLISGDWDKITLVNDEQVLYAGPVSDKGGKYDLRKIALPLPNNDLQVVKIRAVVVNREGVADSDEADIVWDNRAPRLARFEGMPLVSEPNYLFAWEGNDEQPDGSAGEPAGLLLIERYDDETTNKSEIRTLYYPITGTSGQDTLTLMDKFGVHTLTAFLVDKADADQNRPDSMAARIGRGDTSWMTHPSESKSISVRYNPIEVANFPNPFDPTKEYTSLIFPINSDDGSPVRITILDAFGRLVHKKEVVCKRRFQVGDESDTPELRWDGRNDRGEIVANGGYICIIDVLKTGERYVRKIAVLKVNSTN